MVFGADVHDPKGSRKLCTKKFALTSGPYQSWVESAETLGGPMLATFIFSVVLGCLA